MLILLPGMDGTGELFQPFIRYLDEAVSVEVICYPRGKELAYAEVASHVRTMQPRTEPITLIAESFSGPIALRLMRHPSLNIQTLVLICSFASYPFGLLGAVLARLPWKALFAFRPPKFAIRWFLLGLRLRMIGTRHTVRDLERSGQRAGGPHKGCTPLFWWSNSVGGCKSQNDRHLCQPRPCSRRESQTLASLSLPGVGGIYD